MANYELELGPLLEREGGGKLHKVAADRGGWTKYGISERAHPGLDIAALTRDEAGAIYYRQYWQPLRLDEMHSQAIARVLFDAAVNHGVHRAVVLAQRVFPVTLLQRDGIMGPRTFSAIAFRTDRFVAEYTVERQRYYHRIATLDPTQREFFRGWIGRTLLLVARPDDTRANTRSGRVA